VDEIAPWRVRTSNSYHKYINMCSTKDVEYNYPVTMLRVVDNMRVHDTIDVSMKYSRQIFPRIS
jgi:hypothetical protein